jgi:putative transposase
MMKKGQFTQEQIVRILQQAEKAEKTVAELCKEHGITQQTYYRWRRVYGGLDVPDARRLKELESENARLKKLLAERDLAVDAMKDLLAKNF